MDIWKSQRSERCA